MSKQIVSFEFEVYASSAELNEEDRGLLEQAREVTKNAYAPYSHFNVSAVALLANGNTVSGVNLENASYPAGICAEQALLGAVNATAPGVPIKTIAISYQGHAATYTFDTRRTGRRSVYHSKCAIIIAFGVYREIA
jgi:cytidine deaminase